MDLENISNSENKKRIKNGKDYDSMYSLGINKPLAYSRKRKHNWSNIALTAMLTGALGLGVIAYISAAKRNEPKHINQRNVVENRISTGNTSIEEENKISLDIEGILEDFVFSPESVDEKELNQGIIIWEKIKEGTYEGEKIKYPIGHLYVFKDIRTRKIVGKFAASGGIIGRDVESFSEGVYSLNKFELYPDYKDNTGRIISKGGDRENPWGYGRFYHYPLMENGSIMKILSKKSFNRSVYPDKGQRYLHAIAMSKEGIRGKEDYEKNRKKEMRETDFQPDRTGGCTKISNYGMDFLEERINQGYFRLAYVDNTGKKYY